jgi:putative ATP-binding cassette transporter
MKFKIKNENLKSIIGYSMVSIVTGLLGFFFMMIVNRVIESLISQETPKENNYIYILLTIIVIYFFFRRILAIGVIKLSQKIYWSLREDIIELLIDAPFLKVKSKRDEIYTALTTDVNRITGASLRAIEFSSSIILIIASLFYMLNLSISLFILFIVCLGFSSIMFFYSYRIGNKKFKEVREIEKKFIKIFSSILDGIKEIEVNPLKGIDIYKNKLKPVISDGKEKGIAAYKVYLDSELISQVTLYLLIVFILIFSLSVLDIELGVVISFIFTIFYILGHVVNVTSFIPYANRALISYKRVKKIEKDLFQEKNIVFVKENNNDSITFSDKFNISGYTFFYEKEEFTIGPINLDINKNEIIYIYGGNGSGKTTFINTLLRLNKVQKGNIFLDDKIINESEIDETKKLFSPVFSDYYLFDDFYGIKAPNIEKAEFYLKVFELEKFVTITNGYFSTIELSTGQRKRLVLISAILEEKPIIVLDEWAADQDPYFRGKFYNEILPMIVEREDKTIIAITHDDKYFDTADRLFRMVNGDLIEKTV